MFKDQNFLSFNTRYKNDLKFINLSDTLKSLTYTFIHHIDLWLDLARRLESLYLSSVELNAGDLFNTLMKTYQTYENISNESELLDSQLQQVAKTFVESISETPKLSRFTQHNVKSDAILTMWEYCHYFFVPVRLNQESIPDVVKLQTMRKWLTVVFTLPFYTDYTRKYLNTINNVEYIEEGRSTLKNPDKIENIINKINISWIIGIINEVYNPDVFLQNFIRTFMHVSLMASIEILKKYNPFIVDCTKINPNYDGTWIISLDPMFSEQLFKISSLLKLLTTIKRTSN